jgi:UDP-GlcNAc:undecaprenyl-phosphate GlcNAc-1-phosphate transferase
LSRDIINWPLKRRVEFEFMEVSLTITDFALLLSGAILPAAVTSFVVVALLRKWAPRLGLVDQPGARKVHVQPIPLGGGIGIWVGLILPFFWGSTLAFGLSLYEIRPDWCPEWAWSHIEGIRTRLDSLWVVLGAASVLMLLGLADDRCHLNWKIRLGIQFLVATACVLWQDLGFTAFIQWRWMTNVVAVVWIVAMINAFNMLDNMDALSAGIGGIVCLLLGTVMLLNREAGSSQPQLFVAGLVFVLLGAILGFLLHNRPPARIFMGDAGSYLIGFTLSVATLLGTYADYQFNPLAVLTPLFVMAVPMYDMLTVIAIRLRSGKSPFEADKNHLSHRLVELGFSKPGAVATIYLLTATCGLGAVLLHRLDTVGVVVVTAMVGCVLALIAVLEVTARRQVRRRESESKS